MKKYEDINNNSPGNVGIEKSALTQLSIELGVIEKENNILRQILESASDPILITDSKINIIYANPAWEKLTGYSIDEVTGKNPNLLKSKKTPRSVYRKMWNALSNGKVFSSDEVINKKKNGKEFRIQSSIYPVFHDNRIQCFVQIQHDITDLKKLEELRKEFLSATAHELKTPITVLKLLIQSHIKKSQRSGADNIVTRELTLFDQELDKMVRLINDMLDSSRLESGKYFMSFEEIDIVKLTKDTVKKTNIYSGNRKFVLDLPTNPITVVADPTRLEQVFLNILSNAVKYSPEESTIQVKVEVKLDEVIVSIKDEGIGIPPGMKKLIFDKYYQVKTRSKTGFGLGLYISKEIIKRHNGKIWYTSKEGSGTTFFFSLPLHHI